MKKKINKILIIMCIIITIMPMQMLQVFATKIGDSPYLEKGDLGFYTIQYQSKTSGDWYYITYSRTWYTDEQGIRRIAYCIDPDLNGIGWLEGEVVGYNVDLKKALSDERLWRVYRHGYPYVSAKSLGVETEDDAYLATKQAGYWIIRGYKLEDIRTYFRPGETPINGQNLEDIQRRGKKVIDAIYHLVDLGYNGTETPKDNGLIKINKLGNFTQDENNDYYSQKYSVTSSTSMSGYTVKSINGFPEGSYISDINGNNKNTFTSGENFKVMIPKKSITDNIVGKIRIEGKCQNYPVYYGEARNKDTQNYAVTVDSYSDIIEDVKLDINAYKSNIKLTKIDKETKEKISGVKFNFKYENGTNIGDYTTDKNGEIYVKNLKQGTIVVQEIESKNEYILNTKENKINLEYNDNKTITVENEHKKGDLKIVKVDKDDNFITLGGVEFDLINEKGKTVKHLTTDANGIAEIKNINTGNYTLKETTTKKEYKIALDKDVTIKWNETSEIKVENEKRKGQIKIIKVDKDYNEVKLENVEFQIIDSNNRILETVKTDKNGEAKTSKLPIGEYKIKEVSLGTNEEYMLNEEPKTVVVEEDKINNIQFENEHKKGTLKIYKVDLDNNIPVANVEFEITDNDGNIYTATTDKDGIAYIENIRTGVTKVKETKTNKIYKLSKDKYYTEIKCNNVTEITIKNEKLKGQIEVYKVDAEDKEYKLEGVEFEVIDEKGKVVDKIKTDKDGRALTKRLPIGEYKIKETKTDKMHVLNSELIKVNVKADIISKLNITNERIKGQIKIIKTSKDYNFINGLKQGSPIENVKFEIYDSNKELVDKIVTDKNGIAITKKLDKGIYSVKEVQSGKWYLLNKDEFLAEIKTNEEMVELGVTNESEKPNVEIEKTGIIQATANQEISYNFKIKNTGNVKLDNFVWYDVLPTEHTKITKLVTGTYNHELSY
ncbi:MAG: Cys-Gln thioester bond-forming surface protein [Clostridia bacterium]|nr:Cys-Gln thioester bond-forming surface protein [Clostridia bacterium]